MTVATTPTTPRTPPQTEQALVEAIRALDTLQLEQQGRVDEIEKLFGIKAVQFSAASAETSPAPLSVRVVTLLRVSADREDATVTADLNRIERDLAKRVDFTVRLADIQTRQAGSMGQAVRKMFGGWL